MNWDWAFWIGGAVLGIGALFLLAWAVLWDRSRGRRRCRRCWYDMSGVPGRLCPECGREARSERRLFRTRRRWRWAFVAAAIGALATGTASVPRYRQGGWSEAVPLPILMLVLPLFDEEPVAEAPLSPAERPRLALAAIMRQTPTSTPWETLRNARQQGLRLQRMAEDGFASAVTWELQLLLRQPVNELQRDVLASAVASLLDAQDAAVRLQAAVVLSEWGRGGRRAVRALIGVMEDDREVISVRVAAIGALSSFDDHGSVIVPALLRHLQDENASVRDAALGTLAEFGPASPSRLAAISRAVELGLFRQDQVVRYVWATVDSGDLDSDALVLMLRHEHPAVRAAGAYGLWIRRQPRDAAVTALVAALGDEYDQVRLYALMALQQISRTGELPAAAIERARILAVEDENEAIRRIALLLLAAGEKQAADPP